MRAPEAPKPSVERGKEGEGVHGGRRFQGAKRQCCRLSLSPSFFFSLRLFSLSSVTLLLSLSLSLSFAGLVARGAGDLGKGSSTLEGPQHSEALLAFRPREAREGCWHSKRQRSTAPPFDPAASIPSTPYYRLQCLGSGFEEEPGVTAPLGFFDPAGRAEGSQAVRCDPFLPCGSLSRGFCAGIDKVAEQFAHPLSALSFLMCEQR